MLAAARSIRPTMTSCMPAVLPESGAPVSVGGRVGIGLDVAPRTSPAGGAVGADVAPATPPAGGTTTGGTTTGGAGAITAGGRFPTGGTTAGGGNTTGGRRTSAD